MSTKSKKTLRTVKKTVTPWSAPTTIAGHKKNLQVSTGILYHLRRARKLLEEGKNLLKAYITNPDQFPDHGDFFSAYDQIMLPIARVEYHLLVIKRIIQFRMNQYCKLKTLTRNTAQDYFDACKIEVGCHCVLRVAQAVTTGKGGKDLTLDAPDTLEGAAKFLGLENEFSNRRS